MHDPDHQYFNHGLCSTHLPGPLLSAVGDAGAGQASVHQGIFLVVSCSSAVEVSPPVVVTLEGATTIQGMGAGQAALRVSGSQAVAALVSCHWPGLRPSGQAAIRELQGA